MAKFVGEIIEGRPEQTAQPTSKDGYLRARRAQKLSQRYTDAYRVAAALVRIGTFFKVLGLVVAAAGILIGFLAMGDAGKPFGIGCILAGLYIGIFNVLAGMLISSVGQMQKAMVDGSVNSSPFLNDDERASILSLD